LLAHPSRDAGAGRRDERVSNLRRRHAVDEGAESCGRMRAGPVLVQIAAIRAVGALSAGETAESDMSGERSATARREWAMTRSIVPFGCEVAESGRRTGRRRRVAAWVLILLRESTSLLSVGNSGGFHIR
jgi:hypothetical protein